MTITNPDIYQQAISAIFSAPRAKLGVRRQRDTSRDIMKPRNTAAVFIYGSSFELHASRTAGRMADHVWCYADGTLAHEAADAEVCRRVIALADSLIDQSGSRNVTC